MRNKQNASTDSASARKRLVFDSVSASASASAESDSPSNSHKASTDAKAKANAEAATSIADVGQVDLHSFFCSPAAGPAQTMMVSEFFFLSLHFFWQLLICLVVWWFGRADCVNGIYRSVLHSKFSLDRFGRHSGHLQPQPGRI